MKGGTPDVDNMTVPKNVPKKVPKKVPKNVPKNIKIKYNEPGKKRMVENRMGWKSGYLNYNEDKKQFEISKLMKHDLNEVPLIYKGNIIIHISGNHRFDLYNDVDDVDDVMMLMILMMLMAMLPL